MLNGVDFAQGWGGEGANSTCLNYKGGAIHVKYNAIDFVIFSEVNDELNACNYM